MTRPGRARARARPHAGGRSRPDRSRRRATRAAADRLDVARTNAPRATERTRASGSDAESRSSSRRSSAVTRDCRPSMAAAAARSIAGVAVTRATVCQTGTTERSLGCECATGVIAASIGRRERHLFPRGPLCGQPARLKSANSAVPATMAVTTAMQIAVAASRPDDPRRRPPTGREIDRHELVRAPRERGPRPGGARCRGRLVGDGHPVAPSVGRRSFAPSVGASRRKLKPMTDNLLPPQPGAAPPPTGVRASARAPVSLRVKLLVVVGALAVAVGIAGTVIRLPYDTLAPGAALDGSGRS